MDKFLSGFGLSGFMSSQPQKGTGVNSSGSSSPIAASTGSAASVGGGSSSANSTPVVPASKKVNVVSDGLLNSKVLVMSYKL